MDASATRLEDVSQRNTTSEHIYAQLVSDVCHDLVFEVHRAAKTV